MSTKTIIIDPYTNVLYASFYLYGLIKKFGRRNVCFDAKPFKSMNFDDRRSAMCFIIMDELAVKKYCLYYDDSFKIKPELYEWCDVYGSVNANYQLTPSQYHTKLVSLPPSFGISIWNGFETTYFCISNFIKSSAGLKRLRKFIGKYKRMYISRAKYIDYNTTSEIDEKYIFHLSTLWYNDEWNRNDNGVNRVRAVFIRACKSLTEVNFEGGFFSNRTDESAVQFADCLYSKKITIKEYLYKTKKYAIVFNTPAFWNCHGWKLAEYMALGKAIISLPLTNDLPKPLEHGVNIHFVNDETEIARAVEFIMKNSEYRKKLESGARLYWESFGEPEIALKLLSV